MKISINTGEARHVLGVRDYRTVETVAILRVVLETVESLREKADQVEAIEVNFETSSGDVSVATIKATVTEPGNERTCNPEWCIEEDQLNSVSGERDARESGRRKLSMAIIDLSHHRAQSFKTFPLREQ